MMAFVCPVNARLRQCVFHRLHPDEIYVCLLCLDHNVMRSRSGHGEKIPSRAEIFGYCAYHGVIDRQMQKQNRNFAEDAKGRQRGRGASDVQRSTRLIISAEAAGDHILRDNSSLTAAMLIFSTRVSE